MENKFELGITTFADVMPDPHTGVKISQAERIRQVVEDIVLADELGLDFYGVGEHHRPDFASSSPGTILAAAAARTQHITLGTSVAILSTSDPIRLYEQFATIDAISRGRVELLVGRGAFTETFSLFGYELADYDQLFEEHLDLLLLARDNEFVSWQGSTHHTLEHAGVYPRTEKPLKISMGLGGSRQTVIDAGSRGLAAVLAILGGNLLDFRHYASLYRSSALRGGHRAEQLKFSVHAHGFVLESREEAMETFFPYVQHYRSSLMAERGLGKYSRAEYDLGCSALGAMFVGGAHEVAEKILLLREHLGINRFLLQMPVGTMPPDLVKRAIHVLAQEVAPIVRERIQKGW